MDNIWSRNKALIRRLYQEERKPLSVVKEVLEADHGFPMIPLSTYEIKLRDVLHLRKKLKSQDWPVIHRIADSRGYKTYDILLNGARIPWNKVWKEVRRSRAKTLSSVMALSKQLPLGVEVVPHQEVGRPTTSSHGANDEMMDYANRLKTILPCAPRWAVDSSSPSLRIRNQARAQGNATPTHEAPPAAIFSDIRCNDTFLSSRPPSSHTYRSHAGPGNVSLGGDHSMHDQNQETDGHQPGVGRAISDIYHELLVATSLSGTPHYARIHRTLSEIYDEWDGGMRVRDGSGTIH